ncbi:hypothetical protein C8J57DRAFT_1088101 [Mycena rebaudengoi]|nr:hypothetical protein C8J57DRAFT_1088101 [Mycena rebaudengoi]
MVLSSHSLHGKKIVPEQWRLCQFCHCYIEDPAHVMFVCPHLELLPIHKTFRENVEALIPDVVPQFPDAFHIFCGLLARREVTPLLGKLAFNVLKIFDNKPMLLVSDPQTYVPANGA